MASFQDEFFEYFRKRLENEKRSSPKGVPELGTKRGAKYWILSLMWKI